MMLNDPHAAAYHDGTEARYVGVTYEAEDATARKAVENLGLAAILQSQCITRTALELARVDRSIRALTVAAAFAVALAGIALVVGLVT
jgi:hypothetical protein